ncbi:hypothetical protein HDV00_007670 [Rhizophlyctis rosea]|nr:hypothetical protein HDV00_007670 [Rhizophlyctis rosea]
MHTFEKTCRRLHSILRDPHTVLALFKLEPPHSAAASLLRFPLWANNNSLLDTIFQGPKQPLYYLEKYLHKAKRKRALRQAATEIKERALRWYPDVISKSPGRTPWCGDLSPSAARLNGSIGPVSNVKELHRMIDEELFPLAEFFKEDIDGFNGHTLYLMNPVIKRNIKLWEVVPWIKRIDLESLTESLASIKSLYNTAPTKDRFRFEFYRLQLLESLSGGEDWQVHQRIITTFAEPVIFALSPAYKTIYPNLRLRSAIRSSPLSIPEIRRQITENGETLHPRYLHSEATYLLASRRPLDRWCYATALLQTNTCSREYKSVIRSVLMNAMRLATFSPETDYAATYGRECVELIVKEMAHGIIDWQPRRSTIHGFKEGVWDGYASAVPCENRKRRVRVLVDCMDGVFLEARKAKEKRDGNRRGDQVVGNKKPGVNELVEGKGKGSKRPADSIDDGSVGNEGSNSSEARKSKRSKA